MFRIGLIAALLAVASAAAAQPAAAPADPQQARFDATIAEAKSAMMADPEQGLVIARTAVARAADLGPRRALAEAEARWLEAEALARTNRPEDARPVIDAALAAVQRLAPGSKLHGDLLMTRASVNAVTGQVQDALTTFQQAHDIYAKLGEARGQARALQYIGTIYYDARDYPRMLRYYQQSKEVFQGDPSLTVSAFNNEGDAYKEMRRFREAEASYRAALTVAQQMNSAVLEVRILTNMASAAYLGGALARADSLADRGLIRARGQGTGWEPFLWGVKAQVAYARRDFAAARSYIDRTFAGSDLTRTTHPYRDFHQTAYRLLEDVGDTRGALGHLEAYKRLDDEARDVAANAISALKAAEFDFANQQARISQLRLQEEQRKAELSRSRAQFQTTILFGALGAAAVIVIGTLIAFFSIRRSRNEVAQANTQLSAVNADLEQALAAKTRFLAATSHEIRTPLNGILGMTQVMLSDAQLEARQRERVRLVFDAGQTMKALVDDILDVAKMENGTIVLERGPFDVHEALHGVVRLWTEQAAAKGLAVDLDVSDCPQKIVEDQRRLRQIVFNLMSNAVKFTEKGSVRLVARAAGDKLLLTVTDSGIGIPPEQFEAIFMSFHQVDAEVTRKYGGTGLGLAICRDLAEAMGGGIAVTSEVGVGSTFTVTLPLEVAEATVPAADLADGGWPADIAAASLVIIENNPLTRSVILAALAPAVAASEAVDGDEAADAIVRRRPHLVVADYASAGAGPGVEKLVAASAGALPRPPHMALLVAAASLDEIAPLRERHPDIQVLVRPLKPADLLEALRRQLAQGEAAVSEAA